MTAGQFLILIGVVLPLLAGRPTIPYTSVTPFSVWLAVVAVSTISYASYLLQRYVFPRGGTLLTSILGGLYSSTAATVVLARRAGENGITAELQAGMIAATSMMYVRILVICSIFNFALGRTLALPFLGLAVISALIATQRARSAAASAPTAEFSNPLQLSVALIFALLFVAVSMLATLAQKDLGPEGILGLAALVGFTDVDPFVLSIAQGGAAGITTSTAAAAILIATSSNNVLKAIYSLAFSRGRAGPFPAATLVALAILGTAAGLWLMRLR
jgi:uncharacterized membrane protein (DUF4010 family)